MGANSDNFLKTVISDKSLEKLRFARWRPRYRLPGIVGRYLSHSPLEVLRTAHTAYPTLYPGSALPGSWACRTEVLHWPQA